MKREVVAFLIGIVVVSGAALAQRTPEWSEQLELEGVTEAPVEPESVNAPSAAATGQTLYALGLDFGLSGSVLYRVDNYGTNPQAHTIGGSGEELFDLAIDPTTGRFYGVSPDGHIYELNASTGGASAVGSTGRFDLNALEFDATGQAWAWGGSGGFYRINKAVGTATLIGNVGFTSGGDLAFDTNGTLYGTTDSQLIRINKTTGAGTLVGSLGFSGAFGLEVDSDGTMYAGRGDVFTGLAEFYRVNKANGAGTFLGAITGAGQFGVSGLSFAGAPPAEALLLGNGRFKVVVTFQANGSNDTGHPVQLTSDTGYFWFFAASNVEFLIKVVNGCGLNNRYWVFAGGLTDVRVDITVTDTTTGATRKYTNPQGKPFQPIQDTNALATCP